MSMKKSFIIIILLIVLIYVTNISNLPNKIILLDGENLDLKTILGVKKIKEPLITTASENNESNIINKEKIKLRLFNFINVKDINVTTIENTKVIPLGNTVGLKLYANGVLVIGMTEIDGKKPFENTGIKEGDLITFINQNQVFTTEELVNCINSCNGKTIEITYLRNGEEYKTNIEPIKTKEKEYKLGLWVRDGAARYWNSNIL